MADIGIITDIMRKDGYIVLHYYTILENNTQFILPVGSNQCAEHIHIRSLCSYYFVSTYIEPVLNFIKENEDF